jgi:putative membrane protein
MRRSLLVSGLFVLVAAWASLLFGSGHEFSVHMAAHMSVVAVAAPLLALAVAGSRHDPVLKSPAIFSPLLASLVELVVVWVWHTPALHELARLSGAMLVAEQTSFLASGFYLWISVVGGATAKQTGGGIIGLLLTAMHMTLLGALLALSTRPFYGHLSVAHGGSPLADQQLGGVIMLLIGGASYLLGGLCLSWRLLSYRKA